MEGKHVVKVSDRMSGNTISGAVGPASVGMGSHNLLSKIRQLHPPVTLQEGSRVVNFYAGLNSVL